MVFAYAHPARKRSGFKWSRNKDATTSGCPRMGAEVQSNKDLKRLENEMEMMP